MADNITEADQLIIRLLAALNSTLSNYTASQESDKADATANQVSLTALVISLIALVVSLLQAVLEYVSSNSAQGDKCNAGAIGEYARVPGTRRWSWRHWRRQYFYPELNLNVLYAAGMHMHDVNTSEAGRVFRGFRDLRPARMDNVESMPGYYSWRYDRYLEHSGKLPRNTIRNGRLHLSRRVESGWALVLPQNLPLKYRLKWLRYLVSHPGRHREDITPRATWAQILTLLNVDPKTIDATCLVSADCIPSALDVPAQKVTLTDLGIFAFCLGFDKVDISTHNRTICAAGETGTITTESLPGFGAVVRFQILSPRTQHFETLWHETFHAALYHRNQVLGSFIFPGKLEDILLPLRYSWLRSRLDVDGAGLDAGRCSTVADEAKEWLVVAEMNDCEKLNSGTADAFQTCLEAWQTRQNDGRAGGTRRWPTILLAASVACLPGTTIGFPSCALLDPFLQVFQHAARSLSSPPGAIWNNVLDDLDGATVLARLLQGDLCRISGHADLISKDGGDHFLSWLYCRFDLVDLERVEKMLLSHMPTYNALAFWHRNPELRQSMFREQPVAFIEPTKTSHIRVKHASTSVPGGHSPSLLEGRLLPRTVELLKSFDPKSWARAMRSQNLPEWDMDRPPGAEQGAKEGGWRNRVQPQSVLWTQIFLLDMAILKITHQLHEPENEPELDALKAVGQALVECWEDPEAAAPLQRLDEFLSQSLFRAGRGTSEQGAQMRVLADMVKVRMLCYIAYMMVIPDSTSLYEASLQGPVMLPMI